MTRDLGAKYHCFKCGAKFYDLHKPAPICPKCGADQRESPAKSLTLGKRSRSKAPEEDELPDTPEKLEDAEEEGEPALEEDAEEELAD